MSACARVGARKGEWKEPAEAAANLVSWAMMTPLLRIIMLGTGDFALPTFEHLIETGHDVVALVTQPDRPQGRKQELIPSLIKRSAQARGIAVDQPDDVNAPRHSSASANSYPTFW